MGGRRIVAGWVGWTVLGCGGLLPPPPPPPPPLPPPGADLVSRSSPKTSDPWTEEVQFRFGDAACAGERKRIVEAFRSDGWNLRKLPLGEPGWSADRFRKGGREVRVDCARDYHTWIAHVDAPPDPPQPIPPTIKIGGGTASPAREALKQPLVCDSYQPSFHPDGRVTVAWLDDTPGVVWRGRWEVSDEGTLRVTGELLSAPPDDPEAPSTWQQVADSVAFTCRHARLWTEGSGRRAWLCADTLLGCDRDTGNGRYVEVRDTGGGASAVDRVAHVATRAFNEPALHVAPQVFIGEPGDEQGGLRVIWGPGADLTPPAGENSAIELASVLERDLDVTAELLRDDEEIAPLVVEVGGPAPAR